MHQVKESARCEMTVKVGSNGGDRRGNMRVYEDTPHPPTLGLTHETCQTDDNRSGWACKGMIYHAPTEDKPIVCFCDPL